jgi:hypothetical protein
MNPLKRNEHNNVIRLPEVKGQEGLDALQFMDHMLDEALIEKNQARVTPPNVPLPPQAMPEHLEKGPYYGEPAA